MTPLERELMLKVKAMTGQEPTGMLDLLRVLGHPDVIKITEAYLAWCRQMDAAYESGAYV